MKAQDRGINIPIPKQYSTIARRFRPDATNPVQSVHPLLRCNHFVDDRIVNPSYLRMSVIADGGSTPVETFPQTYKVNLI